jgi:hypothetical protein
MWKRSRRRDFHIRSLAALLGHEGARLMYRLDNGQPIRTAMEEAGLSIEALADKTKQVDLAGYGISRSAVGRMVSTGVSGRRRFSQRSVDLTAAALGKSVQELFASTPT